MTEDKLAESIADLMKEAIEEYDELVEEIGEALEGAVGELDCHVGSTHHEKTALLSYHKWKERKGKL